MQFCTNGYGARRPTEFVSLLKSKREWSASRTLRSRNGRESNDLCVSCFVHSPEGSSENQDRSPRPKKTRPGEIASLAQTQPSAWTEKSFSAPLPGSYLD
jgi:hypothetical protein